VQCFQCRTNFAHFAFNKCHNSTNTTSLSPRARASLRLLWKKYFIMQKSYKNQKSVNFKNFSCNWQVTFENSADFNLTVVVVAQTQTTLPRRARIDLIKRAKLNYLLRKVLQLVSNNSNFFASLKSVNIKVDLTRQKVLKSNSTIFG